MRKSIRLSKTVLPQETGDLLKKNTNTNTKKSRIGHQNGSSLKEKEQEYQPSTNKDGHHDIHLTPHCREQTPLRSSMNSQETISRPSAVSPSISDGEEGRVHPIATSRSGLNLSQRRHLREVYCTPTLQSDGFDTTTQNKRVENDDTNHEGVSTMEFNNIKAKLEAVTRE